MFLFFVVECVNLWEECYPTNTTPKFLDQRLSSYQIPSKIICLEHIFPPLSHMSLIIKINKAFRYRVCSYHVSRSNVKVIADIFKIQFLRLNSKWLNLARMYYNNQSSAEKVCDELEIKFYAYANFSKPKIKFEESLLKFFRWMTVCHCHFHAFHHNAHY